MSTHSQRRGDRYFEDVELGEERTVTDARTITEADIVNYAGVSGDFGDIHVSEEAAKNTAFGRRIAPGNMVHAIAETIGINWAVEAFSYGHDTIRFVNPVFIGDTITVHTEVTDVAEYNEEFGRIVNTYTVTNQRDETVLVDDHILLVKRRTANE
ncbi:MaoC family dehydratase [Natronorubrum halophilum]|uniref:MaoC family dehydratase n=1 Tax=Natronorubrum halophilum TaxID=1702106 RepID=UPI0010C22E88|nr:MaoC family dehydratase [Natronorubrum halophilum]